MPANVNESPEARQERQRRLESASRDFLSHGNKARAARDHGVCRQTLQDFLLAQERKAGTAPQSPGFELPTFPDDDIPPEEIVESMKRRFSKRQEHHQAKKWFPIKITMDGPVGIAWLGDPHVDDDGCNWPLLDNHLSIIANTEGMFGANIGDSANNWAGRLIKLYADQETSKATAHKLVKYMLFHHGVKWLLWLMGNHDLWADGSRILKEIGGHVVPMEDWQAQFKLVFPNNREARIWAAHQFQGHSMWNTLHGPQRSAHTKAEAHLYVCGHTHNWALHQEESASREFTYWLARARGYKFIDSYAEEHGHFSQQEGAAVVSVFDPSAPNEVSFVQCFADLPQGAAYLSWLRKKK